MAGDVPAKLFLVVVDARVVDYEALDKRRFLG
jgi:hypothetical protein